MQIGQTDTTSLKCVINSVSQFIHLVSCQTVKSMPFQKNCINMVGVLKRLKSVLDDEAVEDYKVPSDENLCKECEELDRAINEAADFMEKWSPKRSKILGVLQSGALLMKMQSSSLEIFHMIFRSLQLQASPPTCVFQYMQEVECLKKEPVTDYIEDALRYQRENSEPCNEHLKKIIELLGLTSNQELLKESIAVEQERLNAAEVNKMNGKLDEINQIVILVCNIRDYAMETELPQVKSAVLIPPYFRCPLSLELMSDPVIVASGQTYERLSIQKWLDHGLTICPKTRMRLTHTTLVPNYTVKSMIATWCEKNDVKLPSKSETNGSSSHRSDTDSTSRSSLQTGNAFDQKQKGDISSRLSVDTEKYEQQQSPAPSSYIYSRSESFSSSVSSTDCVLPVSKEMQMRGMSNKHENLKELSKGNTNGCPASPANRELEISDELTTTLHASKLVEDLYSKSNEVQTRAAEEIRLLTKHNKENRIIIGQCGVTIPLLSLLYSDVKITQEHAVTALLNLSINDNNKGLIMEAGAIEPLVHVLKTGNDGAKENSAASLFSLSVVENNKAKIGHSGAVKALVDLLGSSGTLRGKKDAATALYNLSICHENKARIVQTGAVKYLVQLMEHIGEGMVDKAVALLANLSTIAEGRLAIAREGGIPLLVEIVESGSRRGKENAASILLQLCLHNSKYCTLVLQEGAVPPLVALSQSGTPRAKEKAQQLLSHFRNQREGATGKGKS